MNHNSPTRKTDGTKGANQCNPIHTPDTANANNGTAGIASVPVTCATPCAAAPGGPPSGSCSAQTAERRSCLRNQAWDSMSRARTFASFLCSRLDSATVEMTADEAMGMLALAAQAQRDIQAAQAILVDLQTLTRRTHDLSNLD